MRLKKSIFQNIFWRGLYFLSVFVLNILISRYFRAAGSGWIYYVINNLSLLLLITGASLESGAGYYAAKNEISPAKIAGFCFFWAMTGTIVSSFFLFLSPKLILGNALITHEYLIAYIAYVLGFLLINYYSALFYAIQDYFIPNFILLCSNLIIIYFALFFRKSGIFHSHFVIIYFSFFLLQGFVLAAIYFLKNHYLFTGFLSLSEIKKISKYSLIALSANVIFFLVYRIDYWFVKLFCSDQDLGNYIQVSKLGQIFLLVPTMLAAIIFPKTASQLDENMRSSLQSLSRILFTIYFSLIIILVICGKWLFPFIYGPTFDEMYKPFLYLSVGILSLSTQALLAAYFAGKNKLATNLIGSVIALIIIVTGDILLVPKYGINAAAAVSSSGYLCYLLYSIFVFNKEHKTKLSDFFVLKQSDISHLKSFS